MDFNAGIEIIEVESSSNFERKHTFSGEQLNPSADTQVVIASIFVKQNNSGVNIQELTQSISEKIDNDSHLNEKLNSIVFKTLGNSFEHCITIKFDYEIAKQSLRFYKHQDIERIEKIHIPNNVNYKSDLSNNNSIDRASFIGSTLLFNDM